MQSEKTNKKRLHKSVKSLTSVLNKTKTARIVIFLSIAAVLIGLLAFLIYNREIIFNTLTRQRAPRKNSPLLELADKEYEKGLLENSAEYYKDYLKTNPDKPDKISAYKRLFEISLLGAQIDKALIYLKEIELLDKKLPYTYISRLKLFIRMGELPSAKKEIDLHYKMLKGETQFLELVGVYYMKNKQYEEAFNQLSLISYRKRESSVHKHILHCMIKMKQSAKAIKYIEKLESKIKFFDDRDLKAEFFIIKAIAKAMQNETSTVSDDLRPGIVSDSFPLVSIKLLIYFRILNNDHDDLLTILNMYEKKYQFDPEFNKIVGDFFLFKKEYHIALRFYDKIKEARNFTKEEALTYADIQYKLASYPLAIEQLQQLTISHNYNTPLLYKNLSALYAKTDNHTDEFFYLNQGHLLYPEDIGFFVRLAKFHLDNDNHERALAYIEKGMGLVEDGKADYDKRLNILKLAAVKYKSKRMTEQELLMLREKNSGNVENYYKLIEFYLQKGNYQEALRELNTAKKLPMDDKQTVIYTLYELIYSMKTENQELFSQVKAKVYTFDNNNLTCMYKALLRLLEKNYDQSLEYLSYVETGNEPDSFKFKKLYLEGVNYYYKGNFPAALQKLKAAEKNSPSDTSVSFLEDIIKEAQEY